MVQDQPKPAEAEPPNYVVVGPCLACHSRFRWLDVYDGLHCRECDPPEIPSLVKRKLLIVIDSPAGGYLLDDPREARRREQQDQQAEFESWQLPSGETATAMQQRVSCSRRASPHGLYDPPLGHGPVGDLNLNEWFERLPE